MHIFARLSKVNEADRTVEGIIASEAIDRSNERFDYEKSVPHFKSWSEGIAKATEGKNLGNVRVMHGKVVAGVTKALDFNDLDKQIKVTAEIVDDNEWNKVLKGCYTGFSVGGKYGEKWDDPVEKGVKRYEAIPSEYSLVDLPCNPEAQFTVVKADGAEELRKFENTTDNLESMQKWAESLDEDAQAVMRKLFQNATDVGASTDMEKRYAAIAEIVQTVEKVAKRPDVDAKEGKKKYGDVEFADPKNKKYPLDTPKHIRAAWSYIHMPKNAAKYSTEDADAIKAKIAAAWKKEFGKEPDEAKKMLDEQCARLVKNAAAAPIASAIAVLIDYKPQLEKGLWAVSQFACILEQLACMADGLDWEEEFEGDDSELPAQMRAALKPLAQAFLAMAEEETAEALHGQLNDDAALALAAKGDLEKGGARHNAKDREAIAALAKHHDEAKKHVDAMKEHLDAMQASKAPAKGEDDDAQKLAKAADDLAKVTAERDNLRGKIEELTKQYADWLTQPAKPRGVARTVEKTTGLQDPPKTDSEPVLKADGTVDHVATALKLTKVAYQNPRVGLT